jgi:hypothetical protein
MAMRISSPIEALLSNLGRYVCPIYVKQDIRNQTPYLIGTGTLFQDGDESYLITAKHVIDDALNEQLIIAGDNTFIKVYGEQISWEHKQGKKINYDVCVIHLHPKIADRLRSFYRFSEPTDISDISEYNKLILYAFLGHPHTRNKPQRSSVEKVMVTPYYYVLREFLDITKLKTQGKNPTIHFALAAPFKKATDINFARRKPPEPHGISGGGVWKIELDRNTGLAHNASLVGIGIEYLREQSAFIATKIHVAIYAQLMLKEHITDDSP